MTCSICMTHCWEYNKFMFFLQETMSMFVCILCYAIGLKAYISEIEISVS